MLVNSLGYLVRWIILITALIVSNATFDYPFERFCCIYHNKQSAWIIVVIVLHMLLNKLVLNPKVPFAFYRTFMRYYGSKS